MLNCTKCKSPLPLGVLNTPDLTNCPACGVTLWVNVFPALLNQKSAAPSDETLLVEDEAGCFYHPQKKAIMPCEFCGRFMCGLCDVELNGRHICPACLESGKKKKKLKSLEYHRVLYDKIAAALSIYPLLLFWPATILAAPLSLYVAIRYWNAPSSLLPRTRVRFMVAILLALTEVFGWALLFYFLVTRATRR